MTYVQPYGVLEIGHAGEHVLAGPRSWSRRSGEAYLVAGHALSMPMSVRREDSTRPAGVAMVTRTPALGPFSHNAAQRNVDGMATLPHAAAARRSRVRRLQAHLRDERSGRVVFVSHCLLNENTRYLGGAFRPGAVDEVVEIYLRAGTGICQMPCPEQLAWGGVLKRRLLVLYARPWLRPALRILGPALSIYTWARYQPLARRVAGQIVDYQRSGFDVVGVLGVDASPTCGVTTTLDLDVSLSAVVGCPLARLDRRFMNDTVVNGSARPGQGRFIEALSGALARRGARVPLLFHDLRSEAPASPSTTGPTPAGVAGDPRSPRPSATAAAPGGARARDGTRS